MVRALGFLIGSVASTIAVFAYLLDGVIFVNDSSMLLSRGIAICIYVIYVWPLRGVSWTWFCMATCGNHYIGCNDLEFVLNHTKDWELHSWGLDGKYPNKKKVNITMIGKIEYDSMEYTCSYLAYLTVLIPYYMRIRRSCVIDIKREIKNEGKKALKIIREIHACDDGD